MNDSKVIRENEDSPAESVRVNYSRVEFSFLRRKAWIFMKTGRKSVISRGRGSSEVSPLSSFLVA